MNRLNIVSISDIHLGHRRTPTSHIISNLRYYLNENFLSNVDILNFVGDIFDTELHLSNQFMSDIHFWICDLLKICSIAKTKIRILEGTPDHDRKQSKLFLTLNKAMGDIVDLKYFDDISIEFINDFNINVLYIPDKIRPTAQKIYSDVISLLEINNLIQVDYALIHGQFEHQMGGIITSSTHNANNYLKLVKKYIFVGHIHFMSQLDRILAQGSFDRLCHGEEHAKGFFFVSVIENGFDTITFIENKKALVYKTINLHNKTYDEAYKILYHLKDKYKELSSFRILLNKEDKIIYELINKAKNEIKCFRWTIELKSDINQNMIMPIPKVFNSILINKNTVINIVNERLKENDKENTLNLLKQYI